MDSLAVAASRVCRYVQDFKSRDIENLRGNLRYPNCQDKTKLRVHIAGTTGKLKSSQVCENPINFCPFVNFFDSIDKIILNF